IIASTCTHFKKGDAMKERGKKGFTLVELIVVIAIIAVLSAVTIVGFGGFIDQARYSNDTQYAENMNDLLEPYFIENPTVDPSTLDAFDVREILNGISDTPFDFTPRTRNAGFFYLKEYGRIAVSKYDDIADLDVTELGIAPSARLLNGTEVPENIEAPEGLFGNDRLLLTTSGSTVADIVWGIRSGYSHELLENYNDPGFIQGLLQDSSHQELLNDLLDAFDPERTLYVNNVDWRTEADSGDTIERIIFSPGIRNIPTYGDYLEGNVDYAGTIRLPKTVRSIEKYALIQFDDDDVSIEMEASDTVDLVIHDQALAPGASIENVNATRLSPSEWNARLTDYPEDAITVNQNGSQITYDFENLPDRDEVIGYSVSVDGTTHTIRIYTKDGLAGIIPVEVTS
ncbi:MAG: type II secretion system protein, partial [Acholeplasmataceae bacterium]